MSFTRIRFSTDILRRLGEELNPSPDQGVIELVKNAYDADARHCQVEITKTDSKGGSIRITDDGDGMDARGIEEGWLVLGQSRKLKTKRTRLGRIPAGSKGLGRLAALRLGETANLITRPRSSPTQQYRILIDWKKYDEAQIVEDVDLEITREGREERLPHGSDIYIDGLRSRISRMDIKRLARALILLADPFGDNPEGFDPVLIAPEYTDLEKMVRNRYFSDADYHLVATLNSKGIARAEVLDWKGGSLFSADHNSLTEHRDHRPYECPSVKFDLWAFILNSTSFTNRSTTLSEVRTWLGEFGGVHLYENGLRVSPYGNPGNDWLDMNLRRVRSPEERPSTNNSIGRVSVTDTEHLLVQKTDRSGFIESNEFVELREFAQNAMEWMARRRLALAEERRAREREESRKHTSRSKRNVENALESIPKRMRTNVQVAFRAYERSRDKEVRSLQKEVQLYRTLSTAGITAATFAHESTGSPLKTIAQSIKAIERRGKKALDVDYEQILAKPVAGIVAAIDSLSVLGSATLSLVAHGKRRVGRVDVHRVIKNVFDVFQPFLDGRDVSIELELAAGAPYLRGTEAAIESVITNLINNALAAFERGGTKNRKMVVHTVIQENVLVVRVLDNGPGIEGISSKDIWLPGQTTQPNGTGLGLTIVRDTVMDLGGTVDAVENGDLGGAEIVVELPIIGVD